jgi:riboflavin kinase/FMN adenylyltransferase
VHGAHRGRTLGFPTANLHAANELLPGYGVYAVRTHLEGRWVDGVASIGVRPTFGAGPVSIEVFLFDFDGDLYGKHIDVSFLKQLRQEKKFSTVDDLVLQMHADVKEAKKVLSGHR